MAAREERKSAEESTLNSQPQAVVIKREPEKDLVAWTAPARPFKRRDRQFYVTTFAMAGIVALVLFFAEGVMPVILIVSLVFLYYVLSTVEPENVEYKITNKGVKVSGKLTEWQYLTRFWFSQRFDAELLVMESVLVPGRIEFVITSGMKEKVRREMSAYVPYEEVPASGLDRLTGWFAKILPGGK